MEQTLVLLKPDAIQRGLIGEVISRFEKKGLKIVGMKMLKMSKEDAKKHYAHLVSKPFYKDLEKFMTEHPIIAFVVDGKEAVDIVRNMCGPTNATKAPPGTIRGDFSNSTSRNIIHASDTKETARREINFFFSPKEIFDYELNENYLYASDE